MLERSFYSITAPVSVIGEKPAERPCVPAVAGALPMRGVLAGRVLEPEAAEELARHREIAQVGQRIPELALHRCRRLGPVRGGEGLEVAAQLLPILATVLADAVVPAHAKRLRELHERLGGDDEDAGRREARGAPDAQQLEDAFRKLAAPVLLDAAKNNPSNQGSVLPRYISLLDQFENNPDK